MCCRDPHGRQELAAVQAAGVRPAGGAERDAFQESQRPRLAVPHRWHARGPGQALEKLKTVGGRGDREAAATPPPDREVAAGAEPDRGVVLRADGARRQLRRKGRPVERATTCTPAIPDWFNEDLARYISLQPTDIGPPSPVAAAGPAHRACRWCRRRTAVKAEDARFAVVHVVRGFVVLLALLLRRCRRARAGSPTDRSRRRRARAGAEASADSEARSSPTAARCGLSRCTKCRCRMSTLIVRARRRRRSGRQVRRRELHRGDARRGRRHAQRAGPRGCGRLPRRVALHGSCFDATRRSGCTPVSRLDEALPLMADVALRPTFRPTELERLRKERLDGAAPDPRRPGAARVAGVRADRLRRQRIATARRDGQRRHGRRR